MSDAALHAFRALGESSQIPEGGVLPFYLDDRRLRVAVARVDGRLYAFEDLCRCAEARCPLSGGLLTGTTLMCQCHGSRFDVTNGAVIAGPATAGLQTYEARDVDGTLELRA